MSSFKKAIAAGIGALGTGLIAVASDGKITVVEIVVSFAGALATGAATYKVTNEV